MGRQDTGSSWWSRNWGWCLGCGCFLPVLAIAGILTATVWMTKNWIGSNDAIQTAMERLRSDPRAIEALGEPIEPRIWRNNTSFNLNIGNDDSTLETTLHIAGPKGEGRIEIEARQPSGSDTWRLERLLLHLDDQDEPIDLLAESGAADSPLSSRPFTESQRDFDLLAVA